MKRGFRVFLSILIIMSFLLSIAIAQSCTDEDGDEYTLDGSASCSNPGVLDCNDNDFTVYPGAEEIVDGLDNDCNGIVDDTTQSCTDSDKDGYNVPSEDPACAVNGEFDCDDSTSTISPASNEISGNGIDDNCDGQTDESPEVPVQGGSGSGGSSGSSSCGVSDAVWIDCDGAEITTANDGDTVFLSASSANCGSEVEFSLMERNEQTSANVFVADLQSEFSNDQVYAAKWDATWEDDGTNDPNPEYFFDASVEARSAQSTQLEVVPCNGCQTSTCDMPAGFEEIAGASTGGSSSDTGIVATCNPNWDCSSVEWSECDPATNMMTRDTSQCEFTGTGDAQCQADSAALLPSEQSCLAGGAEEEVEVVETKPKSKCNNNGKCDKGETSSNCPKDCKKQFPWMAILLGLLLLLLIGGVVAYLLLAKKKPAAAATAATATGAKPEEKMPFENPNDLNAIMNYIKLSKQRNVPDNKILESLKSSGWKDEQVRYAWMKLAKMLQSSAQQKK